MVGAGIGGLAAAHRLRELSRDHGRPLEITVLEASDRAGGAVGSERFEGALLERGPDTLVTHKPAGIALIRRLGLEGSLVPPASGRTHVVHRGGLVPIPERFAMLVPVDSDALSSSPLLSEEGKLRAAAEVDIEPKRSADEDESVASFVRRRFGDELYERLAEPIAGAIQMADLERLSLEAAFPRFAALEREHGSVTRALATAAVRPAGPSLVALSGGMQRLVETLVGRLPPGGLRLRAAVERIERRGQGFGLAIAGGERLVADAVLVATPAPVAGRLLRQLDAALAKEVGSIACASCATVSLAWPKTAIADRPEGLGFFVPRTSGLDLVAATFVDEKLRDRVPPGLYLVRAFLGGAARSEIVSRPDAHLVATAVRELSKLLGIRETPVWSRLVRHESVLPQPAVGHATLVARLRARAGEFRGLELAGGPLGAYGLPDTISAAEAAAERSFNCMMA